MGILYRNDYDIEYEAPIDNSTGDPLDNTNDGATCSFKVYNADKDSRLTLVVASGTIITVADVGLYQVGDIIEIELDSFDMYDCGAVIFIDVPNSKLTISNTIVGVASANRQVRVKLGSEIAMAEFGTPKVGKTNYGFRGVMPWDHPGLMLDMNVDIRMIFIAIPPSDGIAIGTICDTIVSNCIHG